MPRHYADRIAQSAGIDIDKAGYRQHFAKGEYFRIHSRHDDKVSHLVYPVPGENGLGIHVTPDSTGSLKLGPNAFGVGKVDYLVDPSHQQEFFEAGSLF